MHLLGNFTIHFIGIAPKYGGQVLKQLLIDEEYDLSLFETPTRNEFQIRRKKLRWVLAEMLIFYIKDITTHWTLPKKIESQNYFLMHWIASKKLKTFLWRKNTLLS